MIKRALDAGAHGILVPLLETVEDAKNVVRYSKFPPSGNGGFGSPFSMEEFVEKSAHGSSAKELSSLEYLRQADDNIVIAVQIETKAALQNVRDIAAASGIDVLFVGPFDLGDNTGHPIIARKRDPELVEAITSVNKAAENAGKKSGTYCNSGEEASQYVDQGFNMVSAMTDMVAVPKAFGHAFEAAKRSCVHASVQGIKAREEDIAGPYGK